MLVGTLNWRMIAASSRTLGAAILVYLRYTSSTQMATPCLRFVTSRTTSRKENHRYQDSQRHMEELGTLIVQLYDNVSDVSAALSYSVFPEYNAIARSFTITNHASSNGSSNGTNQASGPLTIQRAASFSTDFPNIDLEMIEPYGDWSHEFNVARRKVDYGRTSYVTFNNEGC
jgi:alpha-galactosidase